MLFCSRLRLCLRRFGRRTLCARRCLGSVRDVRNAQNRCGVDSGRFERGIGSECRRDEGLRCLRPKTRGCGEHEESDECRHGCKPPDRRSRPGAFEGRRASRRCVRAAREEGKGRCVHGARVRLFDHPSPIVATRIWRQDAIGTAKAFRTVGRGCDSLSSRKTTCS